MEIPKPKQRPRLVTTLIETFGFSPMLATIVALLICLIALLAVAWLVKSAPPRRVTVTSGPSGSSFQRHAEAYQKILATDGVTLDVMPSGGSSDNLQRLQAPTSGVDFGFVQTGRIDGVDLEKLMSLGSVAYQPLWIFYRSETRISRLSELAGKRLAIGAPGSGSNTLALTLLQTNGITGPPTVFVDRDSGGAAADLLAGKLDAIFLMGDSASIDTLRMLVRAPDIQIYNFTQADAYVRRYPYLKKIELPEGSIDFGKNLPPHRIVLVGPTVELVARRGLNSALSDRLLEVAKEVHGKSGLLHRKNEFPAPLDNEIPISADAARYYKSGQGFMYRYVRPFWLASLFNRILVAIVPIALLLIPAIRLFPIAYRWRIQLRIYRCYRPLLRLERDAVSALTPDRTEELERRLDEIEEAVDHLKVPASFADQFYILRQHIAFVRARLKRA